MIEHTRQGLWEMTTLVMSRGQCILKCCVFARAENTFIDDRIKGSRSMGN